MNNVYSRVRPARARKLERVVHIRRPELETWPPAGSSEAEFRRWNDLPRTHLIAGSYTEGVQAHWRETTAGERGELVLEGLPYEPGQPVEVLAMSKPAASSTTGDRSLRDSVLEFREPLEPVAREDWDALR